MKKIFSLLLVASLWLFVGCNDSDSDELFKGTDNHINSFVLTTPQGVTYEAAIIGDKIVVTVPDRVVLQDATVAYSVCEQTTLLPDPATVRDWDNEQVFRVISYNEHVRDYTYTVQRTNIVSSGNVVLLTQADVEAFAATGATVVEGSLIIGAAAGASENPVVDLKPLSHLTEVGHDIVINSTFSGVNLAGLESIERAGALIVGSPAGMATFFTDGLSISLGALKNLGSLQIFSPDVMALCLPALESVGSVFIDAQTLGMLDLSSLRCCEGHFVMRSTNGKTTSATANTTLSEVALPQLEQVRGNFSMSDYTVLQQLDVARLASVGGQVTLTKLSALADLDMPALAGEINAVTLTNLDAAAHFNLPLVEQVNGAMLITGNTSSTKLESISLPALRSVAGDLQIKLASDRLERLELPKLERVEGVLDVEYLKAMTSLSMPMLTYVPSIKFYYVTALTSFDISHLTEAPAVQLVASYAIADIQVCPRLAGLELNGGSREGVRFPTFSQPIVIEGKLSISNFRTYEDMRLANITEVGEIYMNLSGTQGLANFSMPDLKRVGTFSTSSGSYLKTVSLPALEEVTELFQMQYMPTMGNGSISIPKLRKIAKLVFNGGTYKSAATQMKARTNLDEFAGVTEVGDLTIKWWGALTDFSGLRNLAASVPEGKWVIAENCINGNFNDAYNPTRQDILEGRYTKE